MYAILGLEISQHYTYLVKLKFPYICASLVHWIFNVFDEFRFPANEVSVAACELIPTKYFKIRNI